MKTTKNLFTLLIFSIAVAFTGGCSAPIGNLLDTIDYIKAVPIRYLYEEGETVNPANDVKVIGVFGGVEEDIDIDKVEINIINDPGYAGEKEQSVYVPLSEGIKDVVITYNNMKTRYTIAVGEEGTNPGGGWGPGGSGIKINW
jgi:hypothetical protein